MTDHGLPADHSPQFAGLERNLALGGWALALVGLVLGACRIATPVALTLMLGSLPLVLISLGITLFGPRALGLGELGNDEDHPGTASTARA
jgi:hypothetical protein